MKTGGIHHITIRVNDQQTSRRFWEDVVGLKFMEIPVSGDFTKSWKGAPDHGVMLATQAGSTYFVIEPPLEGTREDDRFSEKRIGLDHLAFAVDDRAELDSLVQRLRAAGVATAGVEVDPILGKEYVAFRDPDNVQCEAYVS